MLWPTTSARTKTESTCTLDPTAGCSIWPDSEPRPRSGTSPSDRPSFPTTPLWRQTHWRSAPEIYRLLCACLWRVQPYYQYQEDWGDGTGNRIPHAPPPPSIYIGSHKLNVVNWFQYLVSTISSKLSLESETNSRIAKASAVMSKLHKGCSPTTTWRWTPRWRCTEPASWAHSSTPVKFGHHTLLTRWDWTVSICTFSIRWQDKIPNMDVLERAWAPTILTLPSQRHLR